MTDTNTGNEPGTEVESIPLLDPNELRSLASFEDAMAYAKQTYGEVVDASIEIGDGFLMLDNKDALLNVGFIALGWRFTPGDFGADFCILRVMTRTPITVNGETTQKIVMIDGGTGICAQIKDYQERSGRSGGMVVMRGLRKSEYDNEYGHGTTHYLNV